MTRLDIEKRPIHERGETRAEGQRGYTGGQLTRYGEAHRLSDAESSLQTLKNSKTEKRAHR